MEEWKRVNIPGLDGDVFVSSFGRVKRTTYTGHNRWTGKPMVMRKRIESVFKPFDNGNGYKCVSVRINGKRRNLYIHRLVAEAFIANPERYKEVNHLDFNRGNNRVENLEWCTHSGNMKHSSERLRHPRACQRKGTYGKGIRLKNGRFEVAVYHDCKQFYVGRFDRLEDAEAARNRKYKELRIWDYARIHC